MALAGSNIQYPPFRLVFLALIIAVVLGMITVELKKDDIAIDLTQEVNKALVFSGLPLVNVSFEGRDGTISGILTDETQPAKIIEVVSGVNGVRHVNNQLETKPGSSSSVANSENVLAEADDPEFENGLYIPSRVHPLEKYNLSEVKFGYSQLTLSEKSFPVLDRLAKILKRHEQIQLEISVHTDNQGTAIGQIASSQSRAENIRYYLIEKGVQAERLVAKGYGASRPVAMNDTVEGRAKNRRVEIRVLKDR